MHAAHSTIAAPIRSRPHLMQQERAISFSTLMTLQGPAGEDGDAARGMSEQQSPRSRLDAGPGAGVVDTWSSFSQAELTAELVTRRIQV
jgi:hypothetical protein